MPSGGNLNTKERFSEEVIASLRRDIAEAGGNEVFWAGNIDENGIVVSVTLGSRGQIDEVVINQSVARAGNVLIHNHPSGYLEPSDADMSIAVHASDSAVGFYIINNDASNVYVVVEPVKPKVTVYLDADQTASYLSAGGPLSKKNPLYEERPSQLALVKAICEAFNKDQVAVFEAGTGVGKSYAYLVPAMLWAKYNKERVVISTGTINLQQQLMEKDVPATISLLGLEHDIKAVLLKGRQNYVCRRRLADAAAERDLFSEETETFDRISDWVKTSPTGSRSDLSFMPPESLWGRVNSESDACMGARCPYHETCFVMRVRKEAMDANIVIVNHHLLFADIESRMNGAGYEDAVVLPPYRRLIFDEAHGIEDSATSFFSEGLNRFKIIKQVNLLFRQRHSSISGFFVQVSALSSVEDRMAEATACVNGIKDALLALDDAALDALMDDRSAKIDEGSASRFDRMFAALSRLQQALALFAALVREVMEGIAEDDSDVPCVWEAKTVLRRLEDIIVLCKNFPEWHEREDKVFWMQKQVLGARTAGEEALTYVQFFQTPLDIAPLMNSGVFEPMHTVVCTSATLKTGKNFSYWMRRTGASFVDEQRLSVSQFESPFPYKTNVLFAVPNDAPFPDQSYAFQNYIEETVSNLILASGGRTLVLFTSYDSLRKTYDATRLRLRDTEFTLIKQGDDDRFRLMELFKQDRTSVLFATDSFWEGVDIPGESLSQVVIVKLPFAVPNDPVFAARSEAVEKRGGSSFMELSVPQAVVKFRQGFGRLMRRTDDRGCIVVLDRRIVEKRYGKQFTESVPQSRRMYNPLSDILAAVTDFLS